MKAGPGTKETRSATIAKFIQVLGEIGIKPNLSYGRNDGKCRSARERGIGRTKTSEVFAPLSSGSLRSYSRVATARQKRRNPINKSQERRPWKNSHRFRVSFQF